MSRRSTPRLSTPVALSATTANSSESPGRNGDHQTRLGKDDDEQDAVTTSRTLDELEQISVEMENKIDELRQRGGVTYRPAARRRG